MIGTYRPDRSELVGKPRKNPCVRNCCLDDRDVCLGCGRTLAEITGWSKLDDDERASVMKEAQYRLDDYYH